MEKLETYKGYTFGIEYVDYPENPRDEYEHLATFVCADDRRYYLGDEQCNLDNALRTLLEKHLSAKYIIDYLTEHQKGEWILGDEHFDKYFQFKSIYNDIVSIGTKDNYTLEDVVFGTYDGGYVKSDNILDELTDIEIYKMLSNSDDICIYPISAYEHGEIILWLGNMNNHFDSKWDCSYVGFAYITKDEFKDYYLRGNINSGLWKERAREIMEDEINKYNAYLNGIVFRLFIIDKFNNIESIDIDLYGREELEREINYTKSEIDKELSKECVTH